ncbi:MAG: EAL domain-containing protein, partial [Actinomycetota bacterium]|nr:EAL domain-containing protein [Actinomycetota bacterium]
EPAESKPRTTRVPGRGVAAVHLLAIAAAVGLAVATRSTDHWHLVELLVIAAFAGVSDVMAVEIADRVGVSGSFLGILLTAILLGGGPAALVGVVAIGAGWLRFREPPDQLRNNLATYAWFPLLIGLGFHAVVSDLRAGPGAVLFYLLVMAAFVVALLLNFFGVLAYQRYRSGAPIVQTARLTLVPILPAELFSGVLTMAAVYVAHQLGTTGIALFGLVVVVFQYLIGELLKSKQRSVELQRIATTDELTGLANRERFSEAIQERAAVAREAGTDFAVMLMDLDRFKEINDTLGHHYGDVLLRDLGPRLVSAVGPGGLVARLGGDEFGILPATGLRSLTAVEHAVDDLNKCVSEPFVVDELSLEVGASIGVARYPQDGEDSHALLRCADIAMYAAKEAQTDYKVYAAEQNQHSVRRLSVLSDIRHALASDQIVVHYQPIVDLDDLSVTGAEGLVRWEHPKLGLIPPGAFVQTVEQTGLIGPLTRHVLERSIAECAAWRKAGRELSVAVNLSARNLLDRDLPREIERLLAVYSLPPAALQLEITESMIMSDPDRALAIVTRLSNLGVRMSVDDFGTGYSSLANLRRLPIDELKIDRSFVSPMLSDESDLIIVRSTINLGHDLGLKIIAEGVEDGPTLQKLAVLGCDLAQGYHLSRPLPAADFDRWLHDAAPALAPANVAQLSARTADDAVLVAPVASTITRR